MSSFRCDRTRERHRHMLCRRYGVVRFGTMGAEAAVEGPTTCPSLMWAIGAVIDGQHELLDAWLLPPEAGRPWAEVLGALCERGVEQIDWAVFSCGQPPSDALEFERPRVGHWVDESNWMLAASEAPPRLRRLAGLAENWSLALQTAMGRAARSRPSPLESAESALGCLVRHWERLQRQPGERASSPNHPAALAGSLSSARPHVSGGGSGR
jgi:hypothetical protein